MVKPNCKFELSIADIEHIESALYLLQKSFEDDASKKEVVMLRAKLFHQKNWYRPKENYVGG